MNTRATSALKSSLEAQCLQALRELPAHDTIPDAQKALYDRLESIEDPLAWQELDDDTQVAASLWDTLAKKETNVIQAAAVCAALRGLPAVAACPVDGYI